MRAGQELDFAIARKVMRWTWSDKFNCWVSKKNSSPRAMPFNPSQDISHAFEVAEKIRLGNGLLKIILCLDGSVIAEQVGYLMVRSEAVGESVPHAICLLAIEAIKISQGSTAKEIDESGLLK